MKVFLQEIWQTDNRQMMLEYYITYAYKIIVAKLPFAKYNKQIIYSRLMEHRDITYRKWIYLYIL